MGELGDSLEILRIIALVVALLAAIIGHEIMHGLAALRYGDTTARDAGRLTPNPIPHIDPIGTLAVPALLFIAGAPFLFGWAKPVPVDTQRVFQKGGYNGLVVVSLAGIAYNFTLTLLAAALIHFTPLAGEGSGFMAYLLFYLLYINLVLGIFNLWPIPPLDGAHALGYAALKLGNRSIANSFAKLERWGLLILVLILATPLSELFFAPVEWALRILL